MTVVDAGQYDQASLLETLEKISDPEIEVVQVNGQRYLGCGWKNRKKLILRGTAGNNLGAFADGPHILLYGNGQEGVGNTMSEGLIVVHGRVGDIAGYGMRGGELYIRDNAGYRLGIHMKAYIQKQPVIVVGGRAGAFAGEYMAGGTIIILGMTDDSWPLVGSWCGTGMYGGAIYLRGEVPYQNLAPNTTCQVLQEEKELEPIRPYLQRYADYFNYDIGEILSQPFTRVTPVNQRLYKHMYTGFVS
ncbi:MAG TPA: glutamate synthase [Syntrophomonadaceae bacterium]|nr:glutamate synthase [Syntrophomonadaceae bacterium]HQA07033.1 glutamate synthase [Syntrophomonadaceae bacterium]HQE23336.1 glutamate synthase [Syntrophomonadaceae bacterium]